jgi:Xaa-Pro aminopeptidase/Xaa-Pro dipeptidase
LSVFKNRRKKLIESSGGKEIVVATPPNLFYVTDFFGSGYGIVKEDKTILITNTLEGFRAESFAQETEILTIEKWKDSWKYLRKMLEGDAIVDSTKSLERIRGLKENSKIFLNVRRIKDRVEVERIKKASDVIDRVFKRLETEIKPGRSEFEISSYAMEEALKAGCTTNGFDSAFSPIIIATGANSAYPHAELSERKVSKRDVVLCDISLRYRGYNSDATRTFAVGSVDDEFRSNYNVVKESEKRGEELCYEEESCARVSLESRKVLKRNGLEKFLLHGIGHGVGIEIHELPSISNSSKELLQNNDVVTVEPGVYFKGEYGIRIEDTILVGHKPEPLHRYTKELVTL